jgi:hypothetical protein
VQFRVTFCPLGVSWWKRSSLTWAASTEASG